MRVTDIIRGVIDLIDRAERVDSAAEVKAEMPQVVTITGGENRFKQIFDILSAETEQLYSNSPAEVITGIDSVTKDAGGGLNGPKNPSDLRADSVSMFPAYQAGSK